MSLIKLFSLLLPPFCNFYPYVFFSAFDPDNPGARPVVTVKRFNTAGSPQEEGVAGVAKSEVNPQRLGRG